MAKFLDVDNCIIINDAKRIQQEPAQKKTKTKRQLAKQIDKLNLIPESSETSIYTKLWRYEKEGYSNEPTELIDAVLKVLMVSRADLVKPLSEKPKAS